MKYGQTTPLAVGGARSAADRTGRLYGYQALFGARYVNPQLGAGTPNVVHHGYQVTDAAGNLVDLNGNEIQEPFSHRPGFPGFNPVATQSLAVIADMQEAGIPVTYGYISDLHERKADTTTGCTTATPAVSGHAARPGRLVLRHERPALRRRVPDVLRAARRRRHHPGEHAVRDQRRGERPVRRRERRAVRRSRRRPAATASTHRATTPTGQIGELQANIKGLLSDTASKNTQFDAEPQGLALYVHGQPAADDPMVRQLERDTAGMINPHDPYSGVDNEKITKYQAGALEQRVLHMQTADPLRTPTYTLFPKPDYFFSTSGPNVSINYGFAYDHGYYSPNIDITWAGIVGPGVAATGSTGHSRSTATRRTTRSRRTPFPRRARPGRGSRRPTSGRRCSTCSA